MLITDSKSSPDERDAANLVGRYEAAGDPTVSFDDNDDDNGDDAGDVEPPEISFCSEY